MQQCREIQCWCLVFLCVDSNSCLLLGLLTLSLCCYPPLPSVIHPPDFTERTLAFASNCQYRPSFAPTPDFIDRTCPMLLLFCFRSSHYNRFDFPKLQTPPPHLKNIQSEALSKSMGKLMSVSKSMSWLRELIYSDSYESGGADYDVYISM